jgi:alanine racemase
MDNFLVAHGARLTIDLAAILANWRALSQRAVGATAAVVKANAYGCGIEHVVPALARAGCETFFVAHLSEGIRARAAAPSATIYVLNGLPPKSAQVYARERLRPVLGSAMEIAEWREAFPSLDAPAALHVDTGMNRLGLRPEELGDLPAVFRPALLMTHFVASEIPADAANACQLALFARVRALLPGVPASISNSSGLFLDGVRAFGEALARPGYALYGGNPTPGRPNPMRDVVRLEAHIVQVRDVPAGSSVGYNSTWIAPAQRRIATASLGYADGYLRSGSSTNERPGGRALVNGVLCPIVGRVSMDLITLDVTAVPRVERGDVAVILGDGLTVDTVADDLNTNGYEVLTSLGPRYVRRYMGG